jgi:hypothetical protein
MKTIFETCIPRDDVLSGDLREETFAAHLRDVIDKRADPTYQDPEVFFEHTYPTEGLRHLLRDALGRLSGAKPTSAPIIRLETSFGGGKTHNLIGLFHAARLGAAGNKILNPFVDAKLLPSAPVKHVAGIVGLDLDPVNGLDHGDAKTFTVWGEIAYQIGGAKGYELLRKSDEAGVAPGVQVFERLVGDEPALIMIDEFAAFLRKAEGVKGGNTTLAAQAPSFLGALLSFAAKMKQVVVVITLADSKDAFAEETEKVQKALAEAGKVAARQESIITPTGEAEIAPLVSHRLFKSIDRKEAAATGQAYHEYYELQLGRGAELPESLARAEYKSEIETHYPFSPELMTTLNWKTSTIPDFQRTRGALRLLALTVRRLWDKKPKDTWLIHPHHLDLGQDDILNELISRLRRPQYRQVVEADITNPLAGKAAHAALIDRGLREAGKPAFAERFAITVFLHSIVQGVASGVDPGEVFAGMLCPEDDPGLAQKAAEDLLDNAWFLDWDGHRYRFKTEPSLNKIIADEMEVVGRTAPKEELGKRVRNLWKKGAFKPVAFPSEASEVDDDSGEPKLVIIHFDAASVKADIQAPPELVVKIFEHAGTMQGYRTFKNNLVFMVADADQLERMIEVARRHLAISRIVSDPERMKGFAEEHQRKMREMRDETELQYRVSITRAYRFLYYPSSDAPEKHGRLSRETLPAQEQGSVDQDQGQVVLRVLRQLGKVLTADDTPLSAAYVRSKAWPSSGGSTSTEELRRSFAQRIGLRMLLDVNQLKRTIRDGCKNGIWLYQASGESEAYGQPSPVPSIEISENSILYTLDEAQKLGIPIKGAARELCPECGRPENECECGKVCPRCGKDPCICEKKAPELHAEGAPEQVFKQVADRAHDAKISRITGVTLRVGGSGKEAANDARLLGLAIPQIGKAGVTVKQTMRCELGDDSFEMSFDGSWDRYKQVKTLTDALGKQADKVQVSASFHAAFDSPLELGSNQFQAVRDVFVSLGFGKLTLDAEAAKQEQS